MDENAIRFTQWKRCDPLEGFAERLVEVLGPQISFKCKKGGGEFSVFTDGIELNHLADLSLVRVAKKGRPPRAIDRVKKVLSWPFESRENSAILLVRRDPEPSCLAEDYSLYIRINQCPEIEETVLSVCGEFTEQFKRGICVYSEVAGEKHPGQEESTIEARQSEQEEISLT
jgi:hypothetical protein